MEKGFKKQSELEKLYPNVHSLIGTTQTAIATGKRITIEDVHLEMATDGGHLVSYFKEDGLKYLIDLRALDVSK